MSGIFIEVKMEEDYEFWTSDLLTVLAVVF